MALATHPQPVAPAWQLLHHLLCCFIRLHPRQLLSSTAPQQSPPPASLFITYGTKADAPKRVCPRVPVHDWRQVCQPLLVLYRHAPFPNLSVASCVLPCLPATLNVLVLFSSLLCCHVSGSIPASVTAGPMPLAIAPPPSSCI